MKEKIIEALIKHKMRFSYDGYKQILVNSPELRSELLTELISIGITGIGGVSNSDEPFPPFMIKYDHQK